MLLALIKSVVLSCDLADAARDCWYKMKPCMN